LIQNSRTNGSFLIAQHERLTILISEHPKPESNKRWKLREKPAITMGGHGLGLKLGSSYREPSDLATE